MPLVQRRAHERICRVGQNGIYIQGWPKPKIRTYIWCIYGIVGRETATYTVIYGVHIRFRLTLHIYTVSYRILGHFPAEKTIHTPCILYILLFIMNMALASSTEVRLSVQLSVPLSIQPTACIVLNAVVG